MSRAPSSPLAVAEIRNILKKHGRLTPLADAITAFNHMREDA